MRTFMLFVLCCSIFIQYPAYAQLDEPKYYTYLHESFSRQDNDIYDYLIDEFNLYLKTFPDSPNSDEALYMLGSLYMAERDYMEAFGTFIKIKFMYPQSARITDCATAINDIINNKESRTFEDHKIKIDQLMAESPENTTPSAAYYSCLEFLYQLHVENLNKFLIGEINNYVHSHTDKSGKKDLLFMWLGDLHEKERDWKKAIYTYNKITHLFPESILVPDVLFKRGYILYKEERSYDQAREAFIRVLTDYPQINSAGEAQFYLAEMYQEKLDNPQEAITNYQLLIESYPDNWHAVEALKRVAEIHDDAERYQEAINTYYQIYELYPDKEYTPDALLEIRTLYRSELKNYEKAIEILKLFATQYAQREDAAQRLFEAGEIYEDDLQRIQAAIDTYHEVKNKFPASKYARRAQDRIEDLSTE